MIRVYLLRSTEVFYFPIALWSIGFQSAFSLSFACLHYVVPRGPERLLIYTQRVFWRSQYIMGAVGVGTGVDLGVCCTTLGGSVGGVVVAVCGIARDTIPNCTPVFTCWTTFGWSIVCVSSVGGLANRTFRPLPAVVFLSRRGLCGGGLGGAIWRFTVPFPDFSAATLVAVMARYRSKISSSSSITSGSSTSVMSSGTVVMATGGAIIPAIVGSPTFAFPLSTLVGSTTMGHVYICPAFMSIGSTREDWAVSASTWSPVCCTIWPFRSITIGGRDGSLSDASGSARLA